MSRLSLNLCRLIHLNGLQIKFCLVCSPLELQINSAIYINLNPTKSNSRKRKVKRLFFGKRSQNQFAILFIDFQRKKKKTSMLRVGFEPTPFRTRTLIWRLRPTRPSQLVDVYTSILIEKYSLNEKW